ncbi:MAG: PilZ domain-containing protein [Algicola sp.]|nr:PilZ domain-containing protein [Algicola sp.]
MIDVSERGCVFIFRSQNLNVKKRNIFVIIQNSGGEPVRIPARVCNSGNDRGKVNVGIYS